MKSLTPILLICLFMIGCGGPSIVGSWTIDVEAHAEKIRKEKPESADKAPEEMGIPYQILTLNDDGTFSIDNFGGWSGEVPEEPFNSQQGTYTIDDQASPAQISFAMNSGREIHNTFELADGRLIMTMEMFPGEKINMIYSRSK